MLDGKRLWELRESCGLSRKRLASQLEIGEAQIYRYESNQNDPTGDIVSRIARFFNVSTDYLLGHTDDPTPVFDQSGLNEQEREVIAAWRRGDYLSAVRAIVADSPVEDAAPF